MNTQEDADGGGNRLLTLAVIVLVVSASSLVLAGTVAVAPAASATTTELSLDPGSRTVTVGDSVTYDVVVDSVDGGVGSYDLDVSIDDASTARITGASDATGGSAETNVDDSAASISAFAGDTVDSGTEVTIARVTVTGENAGDTTLSIEPTSVSDEGGTQYTIGGTTGADIEVDPLSAEEGTNLSLDPTDRTVAPGASTTYNVTVAAVSGGVGSYDLDISTDDASIARIAGISDATGGSVTTSVDNSTASIDVSGGDTVDSGTEVTIARVTVAGENAGTAALSIEPRSLANESGTQYPIEGTSGATLTVESGDSGDDKRTDLSFDPVGDEVAPGESVTYNVTVGTVSDGVGSYDLNVSVGNTSVARITGTSNAIGGVPRTSVGPGEAKIAAFAGDTVDSGTEVTIARVTVTGENAGATTLSIEPTSVGDENGGDQYAIESTGDATVTVRVPRAPDVAGNGDRATDPDGDGRYEDVNGDGDATAGDATVLFNAVFEGNAAVLDNPDLFDFSGDGEVTAGDATLLFDEVF